ncbi:MAG: GntR family transcriptional regulator [Acidimicrobiales bacterium]|nr:GntR family transcriptional regulator [Acidimicrobiales bacterium]
MALPLDEPLVRRSSGEQAALYIRRLIFEGELRPGMRVPQSEIAQALGISRIPVREALIALEHEGWVVTEMHRGAFIARLDERAVRDHYDLYGLVYGFAVERALDRGPNDLASRLSDIADRLLTEDDPAAFERGSLEFHGAVVDAAATPRFRVVLRALSSMVPGNFFRHVPDALARQQLGLATIARAASDGDSERAAHEYRQLLHELGDMVVGLFAARGLFDTTDPPTGVDD